MLKTRTFLSVMTFLSFLSVGCETTKTTTTTAAHASRTPAKWQAAPHQTGTNL